MSYIKKELQNNAIFNKTISNLNSGNSLLNANQQHDLLVQNQLSFYNNSSNNGNLFYELELGEVIDVITSIEHPLYNPDINNIGYLIVKLIISSNNKSITHIAKPISTLHHVIPSIGNLVLCIDLENINVIDPTDEYPAEYNTFILSNNISNKTIYYYPFIFNAFNSKTQTDVSGLSNSDINNTIKFPIAKESYLNIHYYNTKQQDNLIYGYLNNGIRLSYHNDFILSGADVKTINKYPNILLYNNISNEVNDLEELDDIKSFILIDNALDKYNFTIPEKLYYSNRNISKLSVVDEFDNTNSSAEQRNDLIFLKSDKLMFMSSKADTIFLSNSNIWLSSLLDISFNSKQDIILNADGKIYHGNNASEQAVFGNVLVNLLTELITEINNITVPTNTGPSGIPINKPNFINIKNKLKTLLSKKNYVE